MSRTFPKFGYKPVTGGRGTVEMIEQEQFIPVP